MLSEKIRKSISDKFEKLRLDICNIFTEIEQHHSAEKFSFTPWQRENGGGGKIAQMKGEVFAKVGVNVSTVWGKLPKNIADTLLIDENEEFWASGISLVSHMNNPHAPTGHMNTRVFCLKDRWWIGGGSDLTPAIPVESDTADFHRELKITCDKYDQTYYEKFKKWADEYFYLKHRKEIRGVGGIFFDHLNTGDFEKDFDFGLETAETFAKIYPEILKRNINKEWSEEDIKKQVEKWTKYAEFNLLFDRGIKFGVTTGANPNAYLMSMPPVANW